ncbi:hypothetical protein SSPSH_001662 [Salinisphaera shabanensis E1L3A]|uniref:Uncharacterized protein n=1 Tax=Salinisphaera shabanensis E1L3A TaxID=1033802 RepID=U2FYR3_9GAMM|nr:hypothetical protein SSPSH_001662 [Salinisphaera shabanensis E1L3A]
MGAGVVVVFTHVRFIDDIADVVAVDIQRFDIARTLRNRGLDQTIEIVVLEVFDQTVLVFISARDQVADLVPGKAQRLGFSAEGGAGQNTLQITRRGVVVADGGVAVAQGHFHEITAGVAGVGLPVNDWVAGVGIRDRFQVAVRGRGQVLHCAHDTRLDPITHFQNAFVKYTA